MTITEIFQKMRAACPYPCQTSIDAFYWDTSRNLAEKLAIEFKWRFEMNGRNYGYAKTVSEYEIDLARGGDENVLNLIFESANAEMTRIGKEERELVSGRG